jgi:hypothetical protein
MTNLERPIGLIQATAMVAGVLSVWMAAGVLTLFGSLVCAERGFLWGWAMFWIAHSGIVAASSVVLQTGVTAAKLAAIALLLIMLWRCSLGIGRPRRSGQRRPVRGSANSCWA